MKLIKLVADEISTWFFSILSWIPGRSGIFLRYRFYSLFLKQCGKRVFFSTGTNIRRLKNIKIGNSVTAGTNLRLYAGGNGDESIVIGDHVAINENVMVNADFSGKIVIGDSVSIGPNTVLRASNHNYKNRDILINQQGHQKGEIIIGNDVWIAANAVILPDVVIGEGAVISAGAVVTKDVAPYEVVGGVPAEKISKRQWSRN